MVNLASNLADMASRRADGVGLRVGEIETTYKELDQASARVAGLLGERGLKPGDRVGIMLPNVAEFAVVYYGVAGHLRRSPGRSDAGRSDRRSRRR